MPDTTTLQHEVVLFSQGYCEFSEMVRLHLESRGQKYTERDVDSDTAARDEMMQLGATSTPVTVIDGEVVIGFDEEAIDDLLGFEPYNRRENLEGQRLDLTATATASNYTPTTAAKTSMANASISNTGGYLPFSVRAYAGSCRSGRQGIHHAFVTVRGHRHSSCDRLARRGGVAAAVVLSDDLAHE